MSKYVYAFHLAEEDGEVFFCFPKFPEIISAIPLQKFSQMNQDDIYQHAEDAVLTSLQTRIMSRGEIPAGDRPQLDAADGFINLSTLQSMKIELYFLYKENSSSVSDLSKKMSKPETSIRRLLDLRHKSVPAEIDAAVALFGKRIVSDLALEPDTRRLLSRSFQKGRHHVLT